MARLKTTVAFLLGLSAPLSPLLATIGHGQEAAADSLPVLETKRGEVTGLYCFDDRKCPCQHVRVEMGEHPETGRIEVAATIGTDRPNVSFGLDQVFENGSRKRVAIAYNSLPGSSVSMAYDFKARGREFDLAICAGWFSPIGTSNSASYEIRVRGEPPRQAEERQYPPVELEFVTEHLLVPGGNFYGSVDEIGELGPDHRVRVQASFYLPPPDAPLGNLQIEVGTATGNGDQTGAPITLATEFIEASASSSTKRYVTQPFDLCDLGWVNGADKVQARADRDSTEIPIKDTIEGDWSTARTGTVDGSAQSSIRHIQFSRSGLRGVSYVHGAISGATVGEFGIFGRLDGRILTGHWVDRSSPVQCETAQRGSRYWGNVRFEFDADFQSFTGQWDYCGLQGGTWQGGKAPPSACGRGRPDWNLTGEEEEEPPEADLVLAYLGKETVSPTVDTGTQHDWIGVSAELTPDATDEEREEGSVSVSYVGPARSPHGTFFGELVFLGVSNESDSEVDYITITVRREGEVRATDPRGTIYVREPFGIEVTNHLVVGQPCATIYSSDRSQVYGCHADLGPGEVVNVELSNELSPIQAANCVPMGPTETVELIVESDVRDPDNTNNYLRTSFARKFVLEPNQHLIVADGRCLSGVRDRNLASGCETSYDQDEDGIENAVDRDPESPSNAFVYGGGLIAGSIADRADQKIVVLGKDDGVRIASCGGANVAEVIILGKRIPMAPDTIFEVTE